MFSRDRRGKVVALRLADYKTGYQKLTSCKHSMKRLTQIKHREARSLGFPQIQR